MDSVSPSRARARSRLPRPARAAAPELASATAPTGLSIICPARAARFSSCWSRITAQTLLEQHFQGPYILNTFGGVLNLPNDASYVGRVHRDQRTFSGDLHLMAQLLVMLDDFTEENGATYLSTVRIGMPETALQTMRLFRCCVRAVGPAGSIVVFDSNLWHAAGVNRSGPAAARADAGVHAAVHQAAARLSASARLRARATRCRRRCGSCSGITRACPRLSTSGISRLRSGCYKRDQG